MDNTNATIKVLAAEIHYCNATATTPEKPKCSFYKKNRPGNKPLFNKMELKVMDLICNQYSNKEIAAETYASIRTIESVRTRLLAKTNSKNICGVVMFAIKNNIVRLSAFVLSFFSPEDIMVLLRVDDF
ncbi:MAG: helix-turn-helix transcriptional regulator [Bacteroidota bacterium]|nr:helix-turn-helix transcriptional regulator [Bacteroidota bacterium]